MVQVMRNQRLVHLNRCQYIFVLYWHLRISDLARIIFFLLVPDTIKGADVLVDVNIVEQLVTAAGLATRLSTTWRHLMEPSWP